MATGKVTIDGQPVAVDTYGPFQWPTIFGVTAPEVRWNLDPGLAAQVLAKKEVTISFDAGDGRAESWRRIVVLGEAPSGSTEVRTVILSDVRFYWTRVFVARSFNVRRRTGSVRRVSEDPNQPLQVQALTPELTFAVYSLDDAGKAYTADGMLKQVLDKLEGPGAWDTLARPRPTLTPNDAEFFDRGDVAVGRALAQAGGVDVYVNKAGRVVVTDRVFGAERGLVEKALKDKYENLGVLTLVRMNHLRPKTHRVFVRRQHEIRVDYKEGETQDRNAPYLTNEMQVTDSLLTVSGKQEVQGSFGEINAVLTGVAASSTSPAPAQPGPLTTEVIRNRYLGAALVLSYVFQNGAAVEPDRVWDGRIASALGNYRVTYRVSPRWMDRIMPGTLKPVRAALINAATQTRQPSPVYADHCARPTLRALSKSPVAKLGWNVHSMPGTLSSSTGAKTYSSEKIREFTPAPARVRMLDSHAGLFRLEWGLDLENRTYELVPSLVQSLPSANPAEVARDVSILPTWEQAVLSRSHRVCVVMSAVPAANDELRHLFPTDVPAQDSFKLLGVNVGDQTFSDQVEELFAGLEEARFAWDDDKREECLGAFDRTKPAPTTLVPVNGREVKEYATAVAAARMAQLLDHYEGTQGGPFEPALYPVGSINAIVHTCEKDGRVVTLVQAESRPNPPAPESMLSASTRRRIFGELD